MTARAGCANPEELMRLAVSEATPDERHTWMEHIVGCADCRRELALARAVAEAGSQLTARRWPIRILALAASIVVLVGGAALWRSGAFEGGDVPRGGGPAVTLVQPSGDVPADLARQLVWRSVPGVTSYEAELLDADGAVVFNTRGPDTTVTVPTEARLAPGGEYHWRVTALMPDGRRLQSVAESLRVTSP